MRTPGFCYFLILPLLAFFISCTPNHSQLPDPETLPFQLARVSEPAGNFFCVDLDNDGRDELMQISSGNPTGLDYIHLQTQEGKTAWQSNYPGELKPPHFLDIDGDDIREILVPYIRRDSLFVRFIDARGNELFYFFLIAGEPRREDSGSLRWDPAVMNFYAADLNADGRNELITIVCTGFARQPRGVLIHSLPDGRLLDEKIVGCALKQSFMGDFDGDGHWEVVAQTSAPDNGTMAGGFDDRHSYAVIFSLSPKLDTLWSQKAGEQFTAVQLFYDDFDSDGRKEFLAFTWNNSSRPERATLELIEPGIPWKVSRQLPLTAPLQDSKIIDLDRDAIPEILAICPSGEIWVIDDAFEKVQSYQVADQLNSLEILPDIDGDGIDEIVAGNIHGTLLLAPDFKIKAFFPNGSITGVVRQNRDAPPYLVALRGDGKKIILRLEKNGLFMLKRYGPLALWALGVGLVMGFGVTLLSWHRRHKLLTGVQTLALDTDNRGLLLLDPNHRIQMINTTLRNWLGFDNVQNVNAEALLQGAPALAAFLREATAPPAHHREATLSLDMHGHLRSVRVAADPIPIYRNGPSHWLVSLEDRLYETELLRAKAWTEMAQRVAHDLKNPLSTILLTLQRLQMEYRDKVPEIATALDAYTARIIERIDDLRQMASNFMKFVNLEKPNLIDADLNELVKETGEVIRKGLPPDIKLERTLSPNLPFLRLDHEQMRSVLENLVLNAINALPEGGKITIVTKPAQHLQLNRDTVGPREYVQLEVLDTGVGIPESTLAHIFEPRFSVTKNGTGLGLAIVKKIIDDHGGHIEAYSTPDVGSTFCIYLPV